MANQPNGEAEGSRPFEEFMRELDNENQSPMSFSSGPPFSPMECFPGYVPPPGPSNRTGSSTPSGPWVQPSPSSNMVPGRQTDSLASTIHGTQADVLPIIVPSPLLRVSKLLAGYHKIEAWERDVSLILRKALLYDLVQKDIPRPDPTHPLFSKWEFFSEMVRAWLYNQLSTSLAAQVRESDYPQDYADDLYVAIRKVVVGHGHNRCKDVWYALADIRRKQYKSTEAFVQGFQDTFMLAKSLNVAPTPYIAFLMLLREVKTDLPHWVEGVEATMWDDVATSFTEQNLLDYCYTAKSEARAGRF